MKDAQLARLVDRFMRGMHAGLQSRAHAFDAEGVGPAGGMILLTLADIEPASIQTLVQHVTRDKSQMTRALKSLTDKGLVARTPLKRDARVCILSLTPKGHQTVVALQNALTEVIGRLLKPLAAKEQEQLRDLLSKAVGDPSQTLLP